jgi:23S rRNA pseudouridine2605 synthase
MISIEKSLSWIVSEKKSEDTALRLQVYLARAGIGSRRKCETYIEEGRVRVNGVRVSRQGVKVGPEDMISFDGKAVFMENRHVYLALNKPAGYICSAKDRGGRPLIYDLVPNSFPVRLHSIGRLDYMSSGLIFLTNDGNFTMHISHPSREIEKEYIVQSREIIPEDFLQEFCSGFYLEGETYRCRRYTILEDRKVRLVLVEGKNREIRKVFSAKRIKIKKIHRIRIGMVGIEGIKSGEYRNLRRQEVQWFLKQGN